MSGTSYLKPYKSALTEFKDPEIKAYLESNGIYFCQIMYNYLENAIPLFTNPIKVQYRLSDKVEPKLYSQGYIGDGITKTFLFTETPPTEAPPDELDNILFRYTVDDIVVDGNYDLTSNLVTLTTIPSLNSKIQLQWYHIGKFNIDLYPQEIYLLSQWIIVCWSESNQNDILDIKRLLGDTDFKLNDNSATTRAKSGWYVVNSEMVNKKMNKFSWESRLLKLY